MRVSRIVFRELGSSPRMRGTPSGVVGFVYKAGIIPAYAGNTFSRFLGMPDGWDHPRVCGEHRLFSIRFLSYRGSSPRMRGTLYEVAADFLGSGIIPAYAGNTILLVREVERERDHPRVCGEHQVIDDYGTVVMGSSPRMRGTPHRQPVLAHGAGIIPAYAGNTPTTTITAPTARDHPRVCGEHPKKACTVRLSTGSSPRMRGTHVRRTVFFKIVGIIPAYAGNTEGVGRHQRRPGDHPRVCGEHHHLPVYGAWATGSSPRMRGTRPRPLSSGTVPGIIPAYAGNTPTATSNSRG